MLKRNMKMLLTLGLLGSTAIVGTSMAGGSPKDLDEETTREKTSLSIKNDDLELTFNGNTKTEGYFAKNLVLLNRHIPDQYSYFKQTVDLIGDLTYGKEKFGHDALKVYTDLRAKATWGDSGKSVSTVKQTVKLGDTEIVTGDHKHKNTKPLINIREAWLKASLNSILNSNSEKLHFIKLGLFPFQLGRGIALGDNYGTSKEFLGIDTSYHTDQFAPGINLQGELVKDCLSYDLYYARLEEKSDDLDKTFNHVKANHVGRASTPWRGIAKNNELIAGRFKWKALDEESDYGTLDLEPYTFYNEASDRKIEFEADAKSELGTTGLGLEYKYKNFEFGAEGAFNFGKEKVYKIDRNVLKLVRGSDGNVSTKYSHIVDDTGTTVAVSDVNKALVEGTSTSANSANLGGGLFNASDRFRPEYTNKYGGWMFVTDAAYTFDNVDLKLAAVYGFASGDSNPHSPQTATVESNKTYKGFVGLQEGYSGKRVPSVLVLDARKIKRPLTIDPVEPAAGDDTSFTDMHYFGGGLKWFPIEHNEDKFKIATNVLAYFKDQRANKYDTTLNGGDGGVSPTAKASKFLGVELNIRTKYEILKDLHIFSDFAVFFPGTYYRDIKGTPLRDDVFNKLDRADRTGVDSSNYRLSNDTAFYFNSGISYKF